MASLSLALREAHSRATTQSIMGNKTPLLRRALVKSAEETKHLANPQKQPDPRRKRRSAKTERREKAHTVAENITPTHERYSTVVRRRTTRPNRRGYPALTLLFHADPWSALCRSHMSSGQPGDCLIAYTSRCVSDQDNRITYRDSDCLLVYFKAAIMAANDCNGGNTFPVIKREGISL